ncbi:hypothetical protein J2Z40_003016 [Cytobacillus eiseniae]|uniref:DUF3870 domain-containing protein n=1 Tax=Cytobacillus eiseniae TaxID=762947 RepID=A0ABS4RHQ9_9BACI|nr:DUF3870 domain-containing protein [Cytobacillus eiseniae]MBP2242442.1 hypothetical protein [Cytobacillus eiseniae]
MFQQGTVYVIGDSKTSSNNPIMQQYKAFFVGLVIDRETDKIIEADCSTTIDLTSRFVQSILVGKSILDVEQLIWEIEQRYFGSSQKALMVACKNAYIKYLQIK